MFLVTKEWIEMFRTPNGGYTKRQLDALGLAWPPLAGWTRAIVDTPISDTQRRLFERACGDTWDA